MHTKFSIEISIPDDSYEDIVAHRPVTATYRVSDTNYAHLVPRAVLPSLCTISGGDADDENYKIEQVADGEFGHDIHSSVTGKLVIRFIGPNHDSGILGELPPSWM